MRFDPNTDVETEVRWFFVDDAPFVPFYNRFSSGNWATEKVGWTGVGEVPGAARQWVDGSAPAPFPAHAVCGTAEQWAGGLAPPQPDRLIPLTWIPACCGGVLPPPVDPCSIDEWSINVSGLTGVFCQQWEGSYTLTRIAGEDCAWLAWVDEPFLNWNLIEGGPPDFRFELTATRVSDGATAWQGNVPKMDLDTSPGGTTVIPYDVGSSLCGDPQPDITLIAP